ncbi:MAG: DNA polymerase III subunit alpha [Christensenellaceae bacterium]|jgi:DNA polymerase-3 subunit alpha|nr:DNA polymerase III subunit alpha [Christensenellaceae bacterium]
MIHLHNHTEFSLLDGAAGYKNLINKAISDGAKAVAVTDHGNMYCAYDFWNFCQGKPIKPIIGCEVYTCANRFDKSARIDEKRYSHLILLAKNETGYKNLSRISSIGWTEGFYYKPRVDPEILRKYSEGLICLSACLAGEIPQRLSERFDPEEMLGEGEREKRKEEAFASACEYAELLKDIFGAENFYIEIQNHGILEEKKVIRPLINVARAVGVKIVATNDIHYVNKADSEMQDVMLCIQTQAKYDDTNRMRFETDEFYYKTTEEMRKTFSMLSSEEWTEAVSSTEEIADKCDFNFVTVNNTDPQKVYQIPHYECPNGLNADEYLRQLSYAGLSRRYGELSDIVKARAEEELSVIIELHFAEYYLVVWDFIHWAKQNDIPVGAGRGSGVGSIIAYAIGITNVEPLQYDLIFERFLNRGRPDMPDFDLDFCTDRREEVIEYVKQKYGADRISQIITFGTLQAKAAIKDVARVFSVPYSETSKLTKLAEQSLAPKDTVTKPSGEKEEVQRHLKDILNRPDIAKELWDLFEDSPVYKKVFEIAAKVEGFPRNTSVHAAGVVIYRDPALDSCPLAKNGEDVTTQYAKNQAEAIGLVKMDFLALITLTDCKLAFDFIKKRYGVDVDFSKLGYNDPEVFAQIASGDTDAIFQLEGGGMKKFVKSFRPERMEDIIAGISLYRPGPMDYIPEFLENRKNPAGIKYDHELLRGILDVTYGVIVYQEQCMKITQVLAGYTMTEADKFRKVIAKKKKDLMAYQREKFQNGCAANGISAGLATLIFDKMEKFASYAFNKSHAAAYAVLSYETAFLRRYYNLEFMTAVINNRISKAEEASKYLQFASDKGISMLPPDVNKSDVKFAPEGKDGIRFGLAGIKNVGEAAVDKIISERGKGDFLGIYDFLERMGTTTINKRMMESLIKGGAFDFTKKTRRTLLNNFEKIIAKIDALQKNKDENQYDMFSIFEDTTKSGEEKFPYFEYPEDDNLTKLSNEKEVLGIYVSGHPLSDFKKDFLNLSFNTGMLPVTDSPDSESEEDSAEEESEIKDNAKFSLDDLKQGKDVVFGGIINSIELKRPKNNPDNKFAVLVIEDVFGKIPCRAFNKVLTDKKNEACFVKDKVVIIRGRLQIKDDNPPEVTIFSIREADAPRETDFVPPEEVVDNKELWVRITDENEQHFSRISEIASEYKGNTPLIILYKGSREDLRDSSFEFGTKIGKIYNCMDRLKRFFGEDNVKINR